MNRPFKDTEETLPLWLVVAPINRWTRPMR
jgi:hypothetical protein